MTVEGNADFHCGYVALLGAPNAGKSTLLNALAGAKVSIVSRKAQTTRMLVRAIVMEGRAQIILVDTPGIFAPKRRLDRAMVSAAWAGGANADALCLLIDAARGLDADNAALCAKLAPMAKPKFALLNKIDLVPRARLLALADAVAKAGGFEKLFMVCALNGDGIKDVKSAFAAVLPPGPWLYPEEDVSDMPLRLLASELTREEIFDKLHEELPYQITVETLSWQMRKDGSARIEQTIYVTRETQRKIVLGAGGRTIKAIGVAARRAIAEAADCPVHLFLFVKVKENWSDDPQHYRAMGLDYHKQ